MRLYKEWKKWVGKGQRGKQDEKEVVGEVGK